MKRSLLLLVLWCDLACGGSQAGTGAVAGPAGPAAPAAPAQAAPAAPAAPTDGRPASPGASELAPLRRWLTGAVPPAVPPASELVELALACLASPDPAVRDGIGYEVFVRWLVAGRALDDAEVRRLRGRLLAQLTPGGIPPGESDAVLARSFAALVLSLVAARELAAPTWSDAELEEQVAAAAHYAGAELDLRGYLPGRGWAHAAAHTADWIKMLGRHPRLSAGQAERLAAALADLIVRRHGYSLHHGEEDRVVAALRSLIDRGALPAPALDRFLARLAEPIRAGWPSPFDPVLFAAQRNAHAVLAALFTSLSLARAAPAAAALARVRALLER